MAKLGIGVALAVLLAGPAGAQTITKLQVRRQPPEVTVEQLQDQLWATFVPRDMRSLDPAWPPQNVLEDVSMTTRPYPIRATGMCRRDEMVIRFRPDPVVERGAANAQTPVRAYGVESRQSYRVVEPLTGDWWDNRSEWLATRGWDVCGALTGEGFISADSDIVAGGGLYALQLATAAVAGGRQAPVCKSRYAPGVTCEKVYAMTIEDRPLFVRQCDRAPGNSYEDDCFSVQYPGGLLVLRRAADAPRGSTPSVEVVGDSIIDDSGLSRD